YCHKGVVLVNLKRWEEALGTCERALELEPNNALSWRDKGWAFETLNCWEEALSAYKRALELEPNNAWAWDNKGVVLEMLGRWEGASRVRVIRHRIRPFA